MSNSLAETPLTLKTVLIHDGDPFPGNLVEGSEGPPGVEATVDRDGKLPMEVGEYGPLGPALLMGPVASSAHPTDVDGWVL